MALLVSKIVRACAAPTREGKNISRKTNSRLRVGKTENSVSNTFRRSGAYVTDPVLGDGSASYTPGVSRRQGTNVSYQHGGLKNLDAQSSVSQNVTAARVYDAFGNVLTSTGAWAGPLGYAGWFGYQADATGLKLLGHRYYDPSTGRFLTRDPIKDGRNWYAYGAGQGAPTTMAVPTGLAGFELSTEFAHTTFTDDNGNSSSAPLTSSSGTSRGKKGKRPNPFKDPFKWVKHLIDTVKEASGKGGGLPGEIGKSVTAAAKAGGNAMAFADPLIAAGDIVEHGYGTYADAYEARVGSAPSWIALRPDDPGVHGLGRKGPPGMPYWDTSERGLFRSD